MPIQYKINVLAELKKKGYSTYRIRKDRLFGESAVQQIRTGELVSWKNMTLLCELLNCQPGNIIEYKKEEKNSTEC